jgi:hypothetical protein
MKNFCLLLCWLLFPFVLKAQSLYIPYNPETYHLIQRYEVLGGVSVNNTTNGIRPYTRKGVVQMAQINMPMLSRKFIPEADFNLEYLVTDSPEQSLGSSIYTNSRYKFTGPIYRTKNDLFTHSDSVFDLHINPVLLLSTGKDSETSGRLYQNTRGLEIRATIDNKVGLYTYLTTTQMQVPEYIRMYTEMNETVQGEGFWKSLNGKGYDFFTARGYLTFALTKHIDVQAGHDKIFVGQGYRSMILSDNANNYNFLRVNTNIWKLNYTNIFAQLKANTFANPNLNGSLAGVRYPDKYMAFHHLGMQVTKNFNVGLFESVIFGRGDSASGGSFDWAYMNPLIFYRAMESNMGSPDNASLGADFSWRIKNRVLVYGQFFLDEYLHKEVWGGKDWWANKWATQIGAKYFAAFGIRRLDLQAEYNSARPFTYTHLSNQNAYIHYNQPLAHPYGANFREFIGIIRYQPLNRLFIVAKLFVAERGLDFDLLNNTTTNYGSNLLKPYNTRESEYGNVIGQGYNNIIMTRALTVSYMFKHNWWLDLNWVIRDITSGTFTADRTGEFKLRNANVLSFTLRANIGRREDAL